MDKKRLKIVFAGTPEIAKNILSFIIESGFIVDLVLTKPDQPAGRGQKISFSLVKQFALNHNIPIEQPVSFKKNPETINRIKLLNPDIIIVVAYGLILPKELLTIPKLGCVNIHVSLLPRWRGAAPIQRAIIAQDKISGVTLMQMNEGLDTGDILIQKEIPIKNNETAKELSERLNVLSTEIIIEYLQNYNSIKPYKQKEFGVTYANKIEKEEARINWYENAKFIDSKIRGFNPTPGCFSFLNNELIKIWNSKLIDQSSQMHEGSIIGVDKTGIYVACGENSVLLITELQASGKKRQLASQYILGHSNIVNNKFSMK